MFETRKEKFIVSALGLGTAIGLAAVGLYATGYLAFKNPLKQDNRFDDVEVRREDVNGDGILETILRYHEKDYLVELKPLYKYATIHIED